ncbi:class I adenylate-forming enzyme family protein [Sciscionella marina]|uniref:class I adenylate-forming enzyme family protein n=1 Tax=Sciscionella marina TaxID=508770 RepID=UPI00036FE7DE|nr:class I adenylate-forming enzyme family protein [Sciscionella marina]
MNLTMLLEMAVSGFGERTVVGNASGGFTPAQLKEMALTGAASIADGGHDAVAYLATNGPAFPVAMFAASYAGVPLVPMNYRLGAEQLTRQLDKHARALLIADGPVRMALENDGRDFSTPEEWLERTSRVDQDAGAPADAGESSPAVVIYTSGTTSAPKGVLLRHHNLVSYVLSSVDFGSAAADEAALVSVPPYHIAAVANVISNLYAGRRTVILDQFNADEWLIAARREGVTNALVVPTMLSRILDYGTDLSIPTLRTLAYGGAPMPRSVILRALETWPRVGFVNAYGLTETSSTIAVLSPEDHRAAQSSSDPTVRARLSSVGRAIPGLDLRIFGADGTEVSAGELGRVCVRGDQVSAEYAETGRVVDGGGYFDTRDQGYVDEEGYLFVIGRADDTIIRGGENIAPAEIEDVLSRHPAVLDVAVVGVPDDEWGQRLEAAVVLRDGQHIDLSDLRGFARRALRSSKTPERFVCWDALPRTETGKLVRREVLNRLLGEPGVSRVE